MELCYTREIYLKNLKRRILHGYLNHRNYIEKSTCKQRSFCDHWNYIGKSMWKQRGFFDQQNYNGKSTWKQRRLFEHLNYIKKVCGNNMNFSNSEITSKKHVDMTWKFVEILSSHRCNINVELTWIRRAVPVGSAPCPILFFR